MGKEIKMAQCDGGWLTQLNNSSQGSFDYKRQKNLESAWEGRENIIFPIS